MVTYLAACCVAVCMCVCVCATYGFHGYIHSRVGGLLSAAPVPLVALFESNNGGRAE